MYCANCGSLVKEGETYCKSCARQMKTRNQEKSRGRKKIALAACAGFLVAAAGVPALFWGMNKQGAASDRGAENKFSATSAQSSEPMQTIPEKGAQNTKGSQDGEEILPSEEPVSEKEKNEKRREELAQKKDEKILALSEQEWMLREAARSLVADRLAATSFVTVEPRKQFSVADVVLDGVTGNLIVSEGAKAMYQSIVDGRSISEICQNTLEGAAAQIPQYLTDEAGSALQDMVTELIGVDVFSALDIVNQWRNANDMPAVLLQSIVDEQRRDVYRLTLFLEQEKISAADLYKVAQLMYAIQLREQEIAAVQGTSVGGNWSDYRDLRIIAGKYAASEAELLLMAQVQIPEVLEDGAAERFAEERQKVQDKLTFYGTLAETEPGDISANYDVEGFKEAQKLRPTFCLI